MMSDLVKVTCLVFFPSPVSVYIHLLWSRWSAAWIRSAWSQTTDTWWKPLTWTEPLHQFHTDRFVSFTLRYVCCFLKANPLSLSRHRYIPAARLFHPREFSGFEVNRFFFCFFRFWAAILFAAVEKHECFLRTVLLVRGWNRRNKKKRGMTTQEG